MVEVNDESVAFHAIVSVTVIGHPAVGSELDGGVRPVKQHLVVARLRHLVLMREMALIPISPLSSLHFPLSTHRHQKQVAVIGASGAAEVGVAETVNGVVRVMVTTTAVPTVETRIGRRLNLPKGHNGTRERVTMAVGAHHGVDIRGKRLLAAGGK